MFKFRSLIILILFTLWNAICFGQDIQPDERGYIVKVGDRINDFEFKLVDGSIKELSDLESPVVVLNFFASWCVVCRKEIPHIENDIWKPLRNKGVTVLGVDYMEKPDTVRNFVKEMKITYPVALDEDGVIFSRFARGGVTRNIVLDKNLKIIYLTRLFDPNEFEEMKNTIQETLGLSEDSLQSIKKEANVMEKKYLKDMADTGKQIALEYQGKHNIHLEGRIKAKQWWGKLEIEVSLFEEDIVDTDYNKESKTLHIGYRHYDGVRIAILPMTSLKVPGSVEKIIVYDVK